MLGKILNLSEKEFDLAMDILQRRNLQWIQEHHWINEILKNEKIWKHYKISINGDWNKNFLVGHAGPHADEYLHANRVLLQQLYRKRNLYDRNKVLIILQEEVNKIRNTVKKNPYALHGESVNKPVVVLE